MIGSHVLEHVPDLLGLLKSFERLLVPQRTRLTLRPRQASLFRLFQTTIDDGRRARRAPTVCGGVHSRKTRFDDAAYSVSSRGDICWPPGCIDELAFFSSLEQARAIFERPASVRQIPTSTATPGDSRRAASNSRFLNCERWGRFLSPWRGRALRGRLRVLRRAARRERRDPARRRRRATALAFPGGG